MSELKKSYGHKSNFCPSCGRKLSESEGWNNDCDECGADWHMFNESTAASNILDQIDTMYTAIKDNAARLEFARRLLAACK
jgi:transposase-like protein